MLQVQSVDSVGASDVVVFQDPGTGSGSGSADWFVVLANGEDSAGNPNVDSILYLWNGTALVHTQSLATSGASALEVFTVGGSLYLAVASLTDTRWVWLGVGR